MNRPSYELLPSASLAANEDCDIATRDSPHIAQERLHGRVPRPESMNLDGVAVFLGGPRVRAQRKKPADALLTIEQRNRPHLDVDCRSISAGPRNVCRHRSPLGQRLRDRSMITGAAKDLRSRDSDRRVEAEQPGHIAGRCDDPEVVIEHESGTDRLLERKPEKRCRIRFGHALLCGIRRLV